MLPTIFGVLHTYGIFLALSFFIGFLLVSRECRKRGISPERVMDLGLWILVASVIGARLGYVIPHWKEFEKNPVLIVAVWEGGLTFYGGVLLAVPVAVFYLKKYNMPHLLVADAIAPSIALGVFLARIGCFLNGCCFGKPTVLPWGVIFSENSIAGIIFPGIKIHPTQLYESLAGLLMFFILIFLRRFSTKLPDGFFIGFLVLMYSLWRLNSDSMRYYDSSSMMHIDSFSIALSSVLSIILAIVAIIFIFIVFKKSKR